MGPWPDLQHADIRRVRHLTFGEDEPTGRYFINGRQFMADRVNQVAKLGSTEEWVIRNATGEQHPFHIHVNAFQVVSVNGRPSGARGLQDTVILPAHGVVRIRMRFRDFVGATVYHCHIAAHEDAGMMGILDITRTGRPSRRTVSELRRLREAMKAAHHHSHGG
jgi:FtsP/CotA-like multicopper oxidase with cupredoxin domain